MAEKQYCGNWIGVCLGYGTFGEVALWENKDLATHKPIKYNCKECLMDSTDPKVNKQKIAVKTCRTDLDLSLKNQKRWKQEVDILMKIRHPNVIQALDLPDDLKSFFIGNKLPALCMEYCEGGDLRKTLCTVENCCGLPQTMIIKVCRDISSAIQCLHELEIAHRDLKPENIVISRKENKNIFKVIDLGYAKQLDQSSSQHSHVGTPHYLAPEIIRGCKYTKTVDYWSYGCLIFECCTGVRPFDPTYSNEGLKSIINKESKFISASLKDDKEGDIILTFSDSLPEVNQLNRVLQPKFEELLRLLLDGCPKKRGGNNRWIECVNEIISSKVVTVFCIDWCTEYTYRFSPGLSINDLEREIYKDTGIPEEKQEHFLIDGSNLGSLLEAKHNFIFVFNKDFQLKDKVNCRNQVPRTVGELLRDPASFGTIKSTKRYIEVYRHSVYFIQKQRYYNSSLTRGLKALVIGILKFRQGFNKTNNLREDVSNLKATIDFFKMSLAIDLKKYHHCWQNNGVCQQHWKSTVESWKEMEHQLDKNMIFEELAKIFDMEKSLQKQITEIRAKDQINQAPKRCGEMITRRVEDIETKYHQVKKIGRRSSWKEKVENLAAFLETFLDEMDKMNEEFYNFFIDVIFLRKQLGEFFQELKLVDNHVNDLKGEIKHMQEKRQEDIWMLLMSQGKDNEQHSVSKEKPLHKRSTTRIIKESQALVLQVKETLQNVKEQEEIFQIESQKLDWSFLRSQP